MMRTLLTSILSIQSILSMKSIRKESGFEIRARARSRGRWECLEIKNLDREFEEWYINLLGRLEKKKESFIAEFGENAYERVWDRYSSFVDAYVSGVLGGCCMQHRERKYDG